MKMTIKSDEEKDDSLEKLCIHSQEDISEAGLSAKLDLGILDNYSCVSESLNCKQTNILKYDFPSTSKEALSKSSNFLNQSLSNLQQEEKQNEKDSISRKHLPKGSKTLMNNSSDTPFHSSLLVDSKLTTNKKSKLDTYRDTSEDGSLQKNFIQQQKSKYYLSKGKNIAKGKACVKFKEINKYNEWVNLACNWTEIDEGETIESSSISFNSSSKKPSTTSQTSLNIPPQSDTGSGYPMSSLPFVSCQALSSPASTPVFPAFSSAPRTTLRAPPNQSLYSPLQSVTTHEFSNVSTKSFSPNWNFSKCPTNSSSPGSRLLYPSRRKLYSLPEYDTKEIFTRPPSDVKFIDTHCHLDFLFKRSDFKGSFSNYKKIHRDTFPSSFEGCIAVFCDPQTFGKTNYWQTFLNENDVWGAFGCHPHMALQYNDSLEEYMKLALDHSDTVALGEIGLDYSSKNSTDKEVQKEVFVRQIQIALERKLPLVIHCRDAYQDTIQILKKLVPKNYKIHRHCFTGDWSEAQIWMDEFPNLYLGITALVTFQKATKVHEVVRRIPLNRLLLETDAPYFLPRQIKKQQKFSHPGMAIHVAAEIAALRFDVNLEELLKATRENTEKMYGI